jgi:hypothetical protein
MIATIGLIPADAIASRGLNKGTTSMNSCAGAPRLDELESQPSP